MTLLSGVEPRSAGMASALLNTGHEIGGAATVGALTAVASGALEVGLVTLAVMGFVAAGAMVVLMPSIKPEAGAARFVH